MQVALVAVRPMPESDIIHAFVVSPDSLVYSSGPVDHVVVFDDDRIGSTTLQKYNPREVTPTHDGEVCLNLGNLFAGRQLGFVHESGQYLALGEIVEVEVLG